MIETEQQNGYVYFISDNSGFVKIGVAKNPKKRLKELQTASSKKLKLLASVESEDCYGLEKKLHREHRKNRGVGEWFEMTEENAIAIADGLNKRLCENCGNPPFHYFGISSDWFKQHADFASLSKCSRHLAFYHGKPHYEPGMEIIEDMAFVHRIVLQMQEMYTKE